MRYTKMHLSRQVNLLSYEKWSFTQWLVIAIPLVSKNHLYDEDIFQALKECFFLRKMRDHYALKKEKNISLTDSFPIFFCSRVCHWTACMTMASHLLSRFTIISCMGWWSAFRLQVSRSSRRCWHNRRMEATPRRRFLISQQRDCNTERVQSMRVYRADFPQI